MYFEDLTLKYHGFEPSLEVRRYLQNLFRQLQDEAPSGSFIRAQIEKQPDCFSGDVQVYSESGAFRAFSKALSPMELGKLLYKEMKYQLDNWKLCRFKDSSHQYRYGRGSYGQYVV